VAIPHARPGQVIDIRPLGAQLTGEQTTTLVKTDTLEVIRLVLPSGKETSRHQVPGEITLQCLEGKVSVAVGSESVEMTAGNLVFLSGGQQHAVRAVENASLLLTILLQPK
jgi:quercetin dioxygenase-like cupin family protein